MDPGIQHSLFSQKKMINLTIANIVSSSLAKVQQALGHLHSILAQQCPYATTHSSIRTPCFSLQAVQFGALMVQVGSQSLCLCSFKKHGRFFGGKSLH